MTDDPLAHLAPGTCLGQAAILRMAFEGRDLNPVWEALIARYGQDANDALAMFDMQLILRAVGQGDKAAEFLDMAITLRRDFPVVHGSGDGLKVLCLVTAGDFMTNMPVDFLLEGSDMRLILYYTDAALSGLDSVPEHDIALIGIGESAPAQAVLKALVPILPHWPRPVINADVMTIASLTRDLVSARLADAPALVSPRTLAIHRAALESSMQAGNLPQDLSFPLIIRPLGTQAGEGLRRLDNMADLIACLNEDPAETFYVAPFFDYADTMGRFGKQRIVQIEGRPFASHYAVSDHWIVHYLSAGMAEDPERRAIEADWMDRFDADFAVRHAGAFKALYERIGLDYFGMDCAELPDGRLLIFELDVAMIVHDLDDAKVFPYKKPAMDKLFSAFQDMLIGRADRQREGRSSPLALAQSRAT